MLDWQPPPRPLVTQDVAVRWRSPRHSTLLDVWWVVGPIFVGSPIVFAMFLYRHYKVKTGKEVTQPKEGEKLGEVRVGAGACLRLRLICCRVEPRLAHKRLVASTPVSPHPPPLQSRAPKCFCLVGTALFV